MAESDAKKAEKDQPPVYQVQRKHIYRASVYDVQMGVKPDGSPNMVRQNGPIRRIEVGELIEDLTPEELAAAPERYALVDPELVPVLKAQHASALFRPEAGAHEPMSGPGDAVQKPPLTPDQAVTMKQVEADLVKVDREEVEAQTKAQQQRQAVRNRAYAESEAKAVETQGGTMPEIVPPPGAPAEAPAQEPPPAPPPGRGQTAAQQRQAEQDKK